MELLVLLDADEPDSPEPAAPVAPPDEDDEALTRDEVLLVLYELALPPEGDDESTPGINLLESEGVVD